MTVELAVCNTTMNAIVIGYAQSEDAALILLRDFFRSQGVVITGVKQGPVLLQRLDEPGGRSITAWIPATWNRGDTMTRRPFTSRERRVASRRLQQTIDAGNALLALFDERLPVRICDVEVDVLTRILERSDDDVIVALVNAGRINFKHEYGAAQQLARCLFDTNRLVRLHEAALVALGQEDAE